MNKIWKMILASILIVIAGQIVHGIGAALAMNVYMDPAYCQVWSKIMMPAVGPPPISFYYFSLSFGFISALILAIVYNIIKIGIPGNTVFQKGLYYGLIVFLVSGLGGMLATYLLINLPVSLILGWGVEGLLVNLIAGLVIAWLV